MTAQVLEVPGRSKGRKAFLLVAAWRQFLHYSNRKPTWIKLCRTLLDNEEFGELPDESKAHLFLIQLLASQYDGKVPDDRQFLERKLFCKNIDLEILVERGELIRCP